MIRIALPGLKTSLSRSPGGHAAVGDGFERLDASMGTFGCNGFSYRSQSLCRAASCSRLPAGPGSIDERLGTVAVRRSRWEPRMKKLRKELPVAKALKNRSQGRMAGIRLRSPKPVGQESATRSHSAVHSSMTASNQSPPFGIYDFWT